ncbi:MAG: hypothetical protein NTY99_01745 [DPANN group archaeon]|nr:hypothetical protein [DPANN group archaeon]
MIKKKNIYKVELAIIIVLVMAIPLILIKPSLTGFVSSDVQRQAIDLNLDGSKVIHMHTASMQPFALDYLSVSGEIVGDGDAAVYLRNSKGDLLMVYSNIGKPAKKDLITGFAVSSGAAASDTSNQVINETMVLGDGESIAWPGDLGFSTGGGSFGRTCLETCFLDPASWTGNSWDIVAYVEPGTQLKITELSYTLSA